VEDGTEGRRMQGVVERDGASVKIKENANLVV
jgi:hypothetical protein